MIGEILRREGVIGTLPLEGPLKKIGIRKFSTQFSCVVPPPPQKNHNMLVQLNVMNVKFLGKINIWKNTSDKLTLGGAQPGARATKIWIWIWNMDMEYTHFFL